MLNDGLLLLNTTKYINRSELALAFLGHVESLYATVKFDIVWVDPTNNRSHAVSRIHCTAELIAEVMTHGGLAVESKGDVEWSAGISWHRYSLNHPIIDDVPRGFMPNQISIVLPEQQLRDTHFCQRLTQTIRALSIDIGADYGVVRPRLHAEKRYRRSPLGYAAGLEDLYWLNMFGPPYVRILGQERLLSLPVSDVEIIAPETIIIRLAEQYSDNAVREAAKIVREYLGEDFFMKPQTDKIRQVNYNSGWLFNPVRLFRFIASLAAERKQGELEYGLAAKKRPAFDYSAMYQNE